MGKDDEPKVSIIILNWNQEEDTAECLESLQRLDYGNYEIILVDNGSVDGSANRIKKRFPHITLLNNVENLGFAEGNNVGIRHALKKGTEYLLLLNNDTIVPENLLFELVKTAESDPKVGIVGAVNYYYDEPERIWSSGAKMTSWWAGTARDITVDQIDKGQFEATREVDYVPGSSLFIRSDVVKKIGGLEPKFFHTFEETDWCFRAKKRGYRIIATLNARIWHKVSRASGPQSKHGINLITYFYNRNKLLFLWRNSPRKCLITSIPILLCRMSRAYLKLRLKGKKPNALLIRYALLDVVLGRYGKGSLDRILSLKQLKGEQYNR